MGSKRWDQKDANRNVSAPTIAGAEYEQRPFSSSIEAVEQGDLGPAKWNSKGILPQSPRVERNELPWELEAAIPLIEVGRVCLSTPGPEHLLDAYLYHAAHLLFLAAR